MGRRRQKTLLTFWISRKKHPFLYLSFWPIPGFRIKPERHYRAFYPIDKGTISHESVLTTIGIGRGISSETLDECYGMTNLKKDAKNNRSVNVAKLKIIS